MIYIDAHAAYDSYLLLEQRSDWYEGARVAPKTTITS